jgi:hypothetical protein
LAASIQKTQPAGTLPVRPSAIGSGISPAYLSTPSGAASENVIASAADCSFSNEFSSEAIAFQS